jgi:hypothetical protein
MGEAMLSRSAFGGSGSRRRDRTGCWFGSRLLDLVEGV